MSRERNFWIIYGRKTLRQILVTPNDTTEKWSFAPKRLKIAKAICEVLTQNLFVFNRVWFIINLTAAVNVLENNLKRFSWCTILVIISSDRKTSWISFSVSQIFITKVFSNKSLIYSPNFCTIIPMHSLLLLRINFRKLCHLSVWYQITRSRKLINRARAIHSKCSGQESRFTSLRSIPIISYQLRM